MRRKWLLLISAPALLSALAGPALAVPFIVENGEPRAEIVTAPEPPRMVKLAAEELRDYLGKISGARLPVVSEPGTMPVKIYVGRSAGTDRLGISDDGLDGFRGELAGAGGPGQ